MFIKTRFSNVRSTLVILFALSTFFMVSTAHAFSTITSWPYDPTTDKSDIQLSYTINPTPGTTFSSNVYDIVAFNTYAQPGNTGASWGGTTVASTGGTYVDYNLKSSTNMPLTGLLLGLVNDTNGNPHLALMISNTAAAAATGIPFATLFPNTPETQIITSLQTMDNQSLMPPQILPSNLRV